MVSCGACRERRRSCPQNCILAPLFPLEERGNFALLKRRFGGYHRITQIIEGLSPQNRPAAARALVACAQAWAINPVTGCQHHQQHLQAQQQQLQAQQQQEGQEQGLAMLEEMMNYDANMNIWPPPHQNPQQQEEGQEQGLAIVGGMMNYDASMNIWPPPQQAEQQQMMNRNQILQGAAGTSSAAGDTAGPPVTQQQIHEMRHQIQQLQQQQRRLQQQLQQLQQRLR